MRALLTALISLLAAAAMACPDLEGDYTCYVDGHELPSIVRSTMNNGVKSIYLGWVEYIIDNQWHEYQDYVWPDLIVTQRKSECIGNELLKAEENSGVYRDGVKVQQAYRIIEVSLKSEGDLLIRSLSSLDGKEEKKNEYGCSRTRTSQ